MEAIREAAVVHAKPSAHRRSGAPVFVVAVLLALTVLATWLTHRLISSLQATRFAGEMQRTDAAIEERMGAYTQALRSGLGLFQSSEDVTREEWRQFVETLRLEDRYPGFKVFTFAPLVTAEQLPAFLAAVRSEPLPAGLVDPSAIREYKLSFGGRDAAPRPLHAPILYMAPFNADNQLALGLDLMQEPTRRAMLDQAAASGEAVLSPRIKLMQRVVPREGTKSEASFIIVQAIRRDGTLLGWLTAACKAEQFMSALLRGGGTALEFEIFDGPATTPQSLLYSTAGVDPEGGPVPLPATTRGTLSDQSEVRVSSRHWTVRYRAPASFFQISERLAPWWVAITGSLATLLFWVVARSGERWRAQAEILRATEAAVRHQAMHDPLTGLANRVLFMDRLQSALEQARRRQQPVALIYLDVDNFKPVNDAHGHHVGDELLKAIGARLKARLRREDTVARLGGDEFALVLADAIKPTEDTLRVGDALIDALREPFTLDSRKGVITVNVGASVGIARFPEHGEDADALIIAADTAMYRAKHSGRNRCMVAGTTD